MNGEFLLDTNVVIRLFAHDRAVEQQFEANPHVLLPIYVLGELYYGAQKSLRLDENRARSPKSLPAFSSSAATLERRTSSARSRANCDRKAA